MSLEIRSKLLGERGLELILGGRLEAATVHELRPELLDRPLPAPRVLLNLSELEAIDPAGMALVMMARVELEATGTRFVVECASSSVMQTMVAAGLPQFVTLSPRRIDSLRALGEEVRADAIREAFAPVRARRMARFRPIPAGAMRRLADGSP